MEKITSFTIDHIKLTPGLYVSRKDLAGDTPVTTFDIRITNPNEEPVLNTAEVHTIEHLAATFLATMQNMAQKHSISDQWDAAPDSICFLSVIMNPAIFFL